MNAQSLVSSETQNTGVVSFSRKVSVRPYESAEAAIFVQFAIPTEGSAEEQRTELIANARAAFFAAKALVFDELGLEFDVQDGVVRELINSHFGATTEVVAEAPQQVAAAPAPAAAEAAPASSAGDSPTPPYPTDTRDKSERDANKKWALARIASHPNEWWDNRTNKKNPKGPDYKHKETGMGVWL